jgi:hypothetical protein
LEGEGGNKNAWIGRVGDRASDQVLLQSKNIVPHFLNHLILVFLFFFLGSGPVKLGVLRVVLWAGFLVVYANGVLL